MQLTCWLFLIKRSAFSRSWLAKNNSSTLLLQHTTLETIISAAIYWLPAPLIQGDC